MELTFFKYQGTGNDFVIVDNRHNFLPKNDTNLFRLLCDRKFGIGADGLILLEESENSDEDFKMVYFNSDGRESSMCGNGGRCLVAFAKHLGIVDDSAAFTATDGFHEAKIKEGIISLKMIDVPSVKVGPSAIFVNTGSPHHTIFLEEVANLDVKKLGSEIRYSEEYISTGGTNVNFVEQVDVSTFKVRTYERGVEDETLSCGTGVTAVALASYAAGKNDKTNVFLETPGGRLSVSFEPEGKGFKNIWLSGPVQMVFKGVIDVDA